jgi:hypothetical protein
VTRRTNRPVLAVLTLAGLAAAVTGAPAANGAATRTAPATVFAVNPVQSSGDQTLTDQKDSATAVPSEDYYPVTLTDLDGSGYLRGTWANVRGTTGDWAKAPVGGSYTYDRHDDRFEQVMAYYWVTEAQHYLQSLGFGTEPGLAPVNAESQDVRLNQYGVDNSFSWDKHDLLRFGKGGVDDAEDAEVIVHEYGHAVHDAQVPGFGASEEAGSIGEAWGDYLAVSVGLWAADQNGWPVAAEPACVMDWDSTSYTSKAPHCLRRLDGTKTVADKEDEVHADGEIWSRALWDIRNGIDATAQGTVRVADRIIVNAQFSFAPDTSFDAAAKATLATAHAMYGGVYDAVVTKAFTDRGIDPT